MTTRAVVAATAAASGAEMEAVVGVVIPLQLLLLLLRVGWELPLGTTSGDSGSSGRSCRERHARRADLSRMGRDECRLRSCCCCDGGGGLATHWHTPRNEGRGHKRHTSSLNTMMATRHEPASMGECARAASERARVCGMESRDTDKPIKCTQRHTRQRDTRPHEHTH